MVKNLSASAGDAGDMGSIPGSERYPGEEMAIHSSLLAGKIPWIEEPSRLPSMGWQSWTLLEHVCKAWLCSDLFLRKSYWFYYAHTLLLTYHWVVPLASYSQQLYLVLPAILLLTRFSVLPDKHSCCGICIYVHAQSLSNVRLFATPWTINCQASLFMKISRQD